MRREVYYRGSDTYISVPRNFLDEYKELVEEGYLPNRPTGARRFVRREKGWEKEMYLVPREVYRDFKQAKLEYECDEDYRRWHDPAAHPEIVFGDDD